MAKTPQAAQPQPAPAPAPAPESAAPPTQLAATQPPEPTVAAQQHLAMLQELTAGILDGSVINFSEVVAQHDIYDNNPDPNQRKVIESYMSLKTLVQRPGKYDEYTWRLSDLQPPT